MKRTHYTDYVMVVPHMPLTLKLPVPPPTQAPALVVQAMAIVSEDIGNVEVCAVGGDATVPVILVATSHCSSYHACGMSVCHVACMRCPLKCTNISVLLLTTTTPKGFTLHIFPLNRLIGPE